MRVDSRTCKKCGHVGTIDEWFRYPKNGRLSKYCSACTEAYKQVVAESEAARARGYLGRCNTPEYKRQQRLREAEKKGRIFRTHEQVLIDSLRVKIDKRAESKARNVYRAFIFSLNDYTPPSAAEKYRKRYWENPGRERQRVQTYKHSNPNKVVQWQGTRGQREALYSDGSLTREVVGNLFGTAKCCPYCGINLKTSGKALDHLNPLASGGWHSIVNVVICCRSCNARKGAKSFTEWLSMIEEPYRTRCKWMYSKRYGSSPEQSVMELAFSADLQSVCQ